MIHNILIEVDDVFRDDIFMTWIEEEDLYMAFIAKNNNKDRNIIKEIAEKKLVECGLEWDKNIPFKIDLSEKILYF